MIVTTADDYAQLAKEYELPNQQKTLWEQFLTGAQEQYQSAAQQVQTATSYDISGAYANYKKQQLQLMMNDQLGTGFKESVRTNLKSAYENTYTTLKQQEFSALSELATQQLAAQGKAEEELIKKGAFAKKLETAIYDFAAMNTDLLGYDLSDAESIYKPVAEGGLELYKVSTDSEGKQIYELTEYGKDFYDKVLHSPSTSMKFKEYLEEEGLYDDYIANADFYNTIIGGLDYGDRDYSESERLDALKAEETKAAYDELKKQIKDSAVIDKLYGEGLTNLSPDESREILENVKRTNDYVSSLKNTTGRSDDVVKDEYDNNWTFVGLNQYYDSKNAGLTGGRFNDAKKFGQKLGIVDKKGRVVQNEYRKGDVITKDGRYYVITELDSKKDRFGYREVRPGDWNYKGAVKSIF